jgi:hypothetical protein
MSAPAATYDGVAKSPPYGVTAFFQDLDILTYAFVPEKPPSLVGRNFCLAIGVAKSPPYGITAFFQDLDILTYAFVPEKPPSIAGRNFCLAILHRLNP